MHCVGSISKDFTIFNMKKKKKKQDQKKVSIYFS